MRSLYECAALALLCASSLSCTVKELRTDCPCLVTLDLEDCVRYQGNVRLDAWTPHLTVRDGNLDRAACGSLYELSVPRGTLTYSVSVGVPPDMSDGRELRIPADGQGAAVFAYAATLDTGCESVSDTVLLHKQFARVSVRLAGYPSYADGISLSVSSAWDGLSLETLSPLAGDLCFTPDRDYDGCWNFYVLRQGGNGIAIELWTEDVMQDRIALGELLEETGYDWSAEDLDDIRVGIDRARTGISVEIEDWSQGSIYDVRQ